MSVGVQKEDIHHEIKNNILFQKDLRIDDDEL